MADILPFKPLSKQKKQQKQKQQQTEKAGNTLCREGHHKWEVWQDKQFESRSGKLTTVYKCRRCGKTKTKQL